jgi:peptide deformylase
VEKSENMIDSPEGCLSIPIPSNGSETEEKRSETIKRYEKVTVKYTNEKGKEVVLKADGLLAICLQHEIDHLDGILFIDYLSKLKRDSLVKKIQKNNR